MFNKRVLVLVAIFTIIFATMFTPVKSETAESKPQITSQSVSEIRFLKMHRMTTTTTSTTSTTLPPTTVSHRPAHPVSRSAAPRPLPPSGDWRQVNGLWTTIEGDQGEIPALPAPWGCIHDHEGAWDNAGHHYGGFQMGSWEWHRVGGHALPHQATPREQFNRAQMYWAITGRNWGPWPTYRDFCA